MTRNGFDVVARAATLLCALCLVVAVAAVPEARADGGDDPCGCGAEPARYTPAHTTWEQCWANCFLPGDNGGESPVVTCASRAYAR